MGLVLFPLEMAVALAPLILAALLLKRLAAHRGAPAVQPSAAYRPVAAPQGRYRLSTRGMATWLVISLLVLGSWIAGIVLTGGSGRSGPPAESPPQPVLSTARLVGAWTTSRGAAVAFAGNGHFTETALPGPPPDSGEAGLVIPRSAAGTWQLNGHIGGSQDVMLTFPSGTQLDLTVSWQQVIGGRSYFLLQPYLGSSADLNPAYELIRRTAPGHR
jgi:hypothetical protein